MTRCATWVRNTPNRELIVIISGTPSKCEALLCRWDPFPSDHQLLSRSQCTWVTFCRKRNICSVCFLSQHGLSCSNVQQLAKVSHLWEKNVWRAILMTLHQNTYYSCWCKAIWIVTCSFPKEEILLSTISHQTEKLDLFVEYCCAQYCTTKD